MLYSVPVVIFFLLLINFLLFMSYTRRGDLITSQLTLGQDVIQEIDRLETEIKTKKEFLGKTPEYSRGIISYYCDRIASMVGRDISLTSIVVYPEISTNRKTSITSEFDRGNIIIKGQCKNSNSLSELIKSLKQFSWIAEIDITSYNMDFATSNSIFELNARIKSR
jgi:hypothetical protein